MFLSKKSVFMQKNVELDESIKSKMVEWYNL